MNPYEILGIKKTASQKEIKNTYRKLSKKHHPDKGGNAKEFVEIQNAYDILSDEKLRKKYDETGDIPSGQIPIKTAGRNLLVSVWEQVLELQFRTNVFAKLPDALTSKLVMMKRDFRRRRDTAKDDIKDYHKIYKRIIYKGEGADFLKLSLEHKLEASKSSVKMFNRRIEEVEAAEEIANNYDYEQEYKDEGDYSKGILGDDLAEAFRLT